MLKECSHNSFSAQKYSSLKDYTQLSALSYVVVQLSLIEFVYSLLLSIKNENNS